MAASPSFVSTPNNVMLRISNSDSLKTLDWEAGENGGRLQQIYVRVVAGQEVVVRVSFRIGSTIYPMIQVVPPQIPVAESTTSTVAPTPLLTEQTLSGLASSQEGVALSFAGGDGVRLSIGTSLVTGEQVTIVAVGGDY